MHDLGDPDKQRLLEAAVRAGQPQVTKVYAWRNGRVIYGSTQDVTTSVSTGSAGMFPSATTYPSASTYPSQAPTLSVTTTPAGSPLPLPLIDGSITDSPGNGGAQVGGVRRTLTATFADEDGQMFSLLSAVGTQLRPWTSVVLTDGTSIDVPMGVYDVDTQKATLGGGQLQITAPDLYARIQRARFLRPQQSRVGIPVTEQIATLVRGALGNDTVVLNYSRTAAATANLVWDDDRAKAIEDLAAAAGVFLSFDRYGACCIHDLPTLTDRAVYTVDPFGGGVLVSGDRSRSRRGTANVVKVSSSSTDLQGPPFPPVIVWDGDSSSPTYAGPDPENSPELAGDLGVVVYNYSSPTILDAYTAKQTAQAILALTTGLPSSVTLTTVRHPGLDAFDVIDLILPSQPFATELESERHVLDTVTHPLTPAGTQTLTGRSTRTDSYGNS